MRDKVVFVAVGAVAVLAVAYLGKRAAAAAVEAINPFNPDNVFNQGFESVYQELGENNTSFGSDTYDLWNIPPNPTNEQIANLPMGAETSMKIYQWITGSTGNQLSDWHKFKEWWSK